MRAMWIVGVLAFLVGCPTASEDDVMPGEGMPYTAQLRAESSDKLSLLPGEEAELAVRYLDGEGQAVAGAEVEFALMGSAEGASLTDTRARTDQTGIARIKLVAGRATPLFRVRASVLDAEAVFFDLTVMKTPQPTLTIGVAYSGARKINSYSVLVVEDSPDRTRGSLCNELGTRSTDVRMSNTLMPGQTLSVDLGAGRSYAIAAWGSDDTNSKLAWGCDVYVAPVSSPDMPSAEQRTIQLQDIEFMVAADYPVSVSLDLRSALSVLAPLARSVVEEGLPDTATPQASYLLDALERKVSFASTRSSEGLDAALQALLDGNYVGPLRFAEALAGAVSEDGATCVFSAVLTPAGPSAPGQATESSLRLVPPLYAIPSDSVAKEVSLSAVPLMNVLEFQAPYRQETATVTLDALRISLGFGSYAAYLLDAVGQQPERYAERVSSTWGCSELAAWVASRPSSFANLSPSVAASACEEALVSFVPKIRSRWAALDEQRNTLTFAKGELSAHDRTGDRIIDDLGPARLSASWSTPSAPYVADMTIDVSVRMSASAANLSL